MYSSLPFLGWNSQNRNYKRHRECSNFIPKSNHRKISSSAMPENHLSKMILEASDVPFPAASPGNHFYCLLIFSVRRCFPMPKFTCKNDTLDLFAIHRTCAEEFNSFIFTASSKILVMFMWSAISVPSTWTQATWQAGCPAWTNIPTPLSVAAPIAATTQQWQI